MAKNRGTQMCDIARVSAKRSERVQRQGDGNRDVDGTGVLESLRRLCRRSRLPAGHGAFRSRGIVDEML